jgi:hypothetical protein
LVRRPMKHVKNELTCWPTSWDEQTSAQISYLGWQNKAVSRAVIDEVRDKVTRLITPVTPVTHEVAMHIHWSISRIRKRLKPRGIRVRPFSSKEVVNDP